MIDPAIDPSVIALALPENEQIPVRLEAGPPPHPFLLSRTLSLAEAKLETSVLPTDTAVKIHGTGVRPSYLIPWQVKGQRDWTGTGFVISERRILTNAHVVQDATVLQVTRQDDPRKFRARVDCIAHDIDLAIVHVDDDAFWADLPVAVLSDELPLLYSEVKAVGFPTGGSTLCVTKGVVSRIDAMVYVHPQLLGIQTDSRNSPGSVIVLQIDAAINPGNSGGPTFNNNGQVVGVASSGLPKAQNVGYIIPATVVKMFLKEYNATGAWTGLPEVGITVVPLENDSMRRFLKMGENKGVLVDDVAPLGILFGKVKPGDVITHVDGIEVTTEGHVPVVIGGQKVYIDLEAVVNRKAKGEETSFRILREGATLELKAPLGPIPPLAPRFHGYDSCPDYVLVGGIVFCRGCVPLSQEYMAARPAHRFISDSAVWDRFDAYKQDENHELVVLLNILKHDVNLGYGLEHVGVLDTFNEQPVRSLAALAKMVGEAMRERTEEFLRFRMKPQDARIAASERPDIVLETAKVAEADKIICSTNNIPSVASKAMLPFLRGPVSPAPAAPATAGTAGAAAG